MKKMEQVDLFQRLGVLMPAISSYPVRGGVKQMALAMKIFDKVNLPEEVFKEKGIQQSQAGIRWKEELTEDLEFEDDEFDLLKEMVKMFSDTQGFRIDPTGKTIKILETLEI